MIRFHRLVVRVVPSLAVLGLAVSPWVAACGVDSNGSSSSALQSLDENCVLTAKLQCPFTCAQIDTATQCHADLGASADTTCGAGATGSCLTACGSDCAANCAATASSQCDATCKTQCDGNCRSLCAGAFDINQCQDQCNAQCEDQCNSNCASNTQDTCQGKCSAACSATCGVEAQISCELRASVTAQTNCAGSLAAKCMAECASNFTLQCVRGGGASAVAAGDPPADPADPPEGGAGVVLGPLDGAAAAPVPVAGPSFADDAGPSGSVGVLPERPRMTPF